MKEETSVKEFPVQVIKGILEFIKDQDGKMTVDVDKGGRVDFDIIVAADMWNYPRMIGSRGKMARAIQTICSTAALKFRHSYWYRVFKIGGDERAKIPVEFDSHADPEFKRSSQVQEILTGILNCVMDSWDVKEVNSELKTVYAIQGTKIDGSHGERIVESLEVIMKAVGRVAGRIVEVKVLYL